MHPPGVGYFEMFAPVAWKESINGALALTTDEELVIINVDVETAFMYGEFREEISIYQPDGFEDERQMEKKFCYINHCTAQSRRQENGTTDKTRISKAKA